MGAHKSKAPKKVPPPTQKAIIDLKGKQPKCVAHLAFSEATMPVDGEDLFFMQCTQELYNEILKTRPGLIVYVGSVPPKAN